MFVLHYADLYIFFLQEVVLPRKYRTTVNNIPRLPSPSKPTVNGSISSTATSPVTLSSSPTLTSTSNEEVDLNDVSNNQSVIHQGLLLTRQALRTYQSNNHLIHYKYNGYSGSCHDLPR